MDKTSLYPYASSAAAFLSGSFVGTGESIQVLEKATGTVLGTAALGAVSDLDGTVASAVAAQELWSQQTYTVRATLLRDLASALAGRYEEFVDLIIRETGSIRGKAEYEVSGAIEELHTAAGLIIQPRGEILVSSDPGRISTVEHVPVGVVAAITPWNFPLILAMRVVAPAIALGNAVILKPSPETPLSGGLAIASLFEEVGAPAGLFQTVTGEQEFSEALTVHPGVDMIHFTGSTAVGSKIAAAAGGLLKKVSLELGGNNAIVVLDDAKLDDAVTIGAWSSFHFQGQTCISAGRHIVHESLVDAYVAELSARASRITLGDPTDPTIGLGPMINSRQVERAKALLDAAIAQGARVVAGGQIDGLFFSPTVVTGVTTDMLLWTQEVFAPIIPVLSFSTDEEAIALVNDTEYGLANSIITSDLSRGQRIAHRVKSGMAHVNDATCIDESSAPFGGLKASGLGGRAGGAANFEEFTERKWITTQLGTPAYPY